jgi:hypothetical protein
VVDQQTPLTIAWSRIVTGNGGSGGLPSDGLAGQPGTKGGKGGAGPSIIPGVSGEDGTSGGRGGNGGPGAGGPSVGVVSVGNAASPTITNTNFVLGNPGLGGRAGVSVADGLSAETYELGSN